MEGNQFKNNICSVLLVFTIKILPILSILNFILLFYCSTIMQSMQISAMQHMEYTNATCATSDFQRKQCLTSIGMSIKHFIIYLLCYYSYITSTSILIVAQRKPPWLIDVFRISCFHLKYYIRYGRMIIFTFIYLHRIIVSLIY